MRMKSVFRKENKYFNEEPYGYLVADTHAAGHHKENISRLSNIE